MALHDWETLQGAVVDGRFRLRTLTSAGRNQAEYQAQDPSGSAGRAGLVLTLLEPPPQGAAQLRSELLAAAGLQHPSLLRVLAVGQFAPSGQELFYIASEAAEQTLAGRLRGGPLPEDEAGALASDVVEGLKYLHARGLVYRALEPETVVRVGRRWKLADYGRIRPAGGPDRSLVPDLDGSRYVPPEAYEGIVVPASDIWALGVLITEMLTGTTDPVMLPAAFDAVAGGCREKDPDQRPGLEAIREALGLAAPSTVEAAGTPAARSAEAPPVAAPAAPAAGVAAPPAGRQRAVARGVAAALAALAILALWLVFRERNEPVAAGGAPRAAIPPAAQTGRPSPMPSRRRAEPRAAAKKITTAEPRPAVTNTTERPAAGRADFAGDDMNGRRTASGERFDNRRLTAAHPSLPLGTRLRVTNRRNGRSVVVTVNDRGVFRRGYVIRLTRRAAVELDFARFGSAPVSLEVVK